MSQASPTIGANKSGLVYRQEDNDGKKALLSHHKGAAAPEYAEAGMIWLDDAATPWLLRFYDGADWIAMGSIHAGNNSFTPYLGTAALRTLSYAADTGSVNACAIAPIPAISAYVAGHTVLLKPAYTTTAGTTITINGLAAKTIKLPNGSALAAGSMLSSGIYTLVYDGTDFILTNPAGDNILPAGSVVDSQSASYTLNTNLSSIIYADSTIPQNSEGTEILNISMSTKSATNKIRIRFQGFGTTSSVNMALVASLHIDGAQAACSTVATVCSAQAMTPIALEFEYTPGDTASHSFSLHVGPGSSGVARMNGTTTGRYFGGTAACTLVAEEIKA